MDKYKLNDILVKHYMCFNSERFWVDEYKENEYISIVSASISDPCPISLCKKIAKFVDRATKESMNFIFIGPWVFSRKHLDYALISKKR